MKKTFKIIAFVILAFIFGMIIWGLTPNQTGPFAADPSVVYANEASGSEHPYQENYFEFQGETIHYVEAGEGPLVILIHGFPAYWYAMIRQMEALKSEYRVVAIDTLGAGLSDAPYEVSKYTLAARSAHLNALIEQLSPNEKTHLIGHDWGGGFVFAFAQNYPNKVSSVTGISSPPPNVLLNLIDTNETQRQTSAYVGKLQKANPIVLKALKAPKKIWDGAYKPMLEAGQINAEESELFRKSFRNHKRINAYLNWYRANFPAFEKINKESYWPSKDAKLDMPVLIIRGVDDDVFVPEYVPQTQSLADQSTVLELENVGHWPHMEAADQVNQAIVQFLKQSQ